MSLSIRTEAAVLNEKGVDPELAMTALLRGIELYKEVAEGKVLSEIIDIYDNRAKQKTITVNEEKINSVLGISIPLKKASEILTSLGFATTLKNNLLSAKVPSWRLKDVSIPEDLIEEIARIYGYDKLSSRLPPLT